MRSRVQALIPVLAAAYLCAAPTISAAYNLPDSDQRKCYQDVDPYAEISCEGTGRDGAYIINPMSFTDNENGTVTDNNTGLIWQQHDDPAEYNWYWASGTLDALYNPESEDVCGSLDLGGATDWRLPTKKELMGLVAKQVALMTPTRRPAG